MERKIARYSAGGERGPEGEEPQDARRRKGKGGGGNWVEKSGEGEDKDEKQRMGGGCSEAGRDRKVLGGSGMRICRRGHLRDYIPLGFVLQVLRLGSCLKRDGEVFAPGERRLGCGLALAAGTVCGGLA